MMNIKMTNVVAILISSADVQSVAVVVLHNAIT